MKEYGYWDEHSQEYIYDDEQTAKAKAIEKNNLTLKNIVFLVIAVFTVLSPLDILPDMIPIVGRVDDLGALIYLLMAVIHEYKELKYKYGK